MITAERHVTEAARVATADPTPRNHSSATPSSKRPRRSRRPAKVTGDHVLTTAALLALTIVTAIGMCRVFVGWEFLRPLITIAVVVHVAALVLRILRVHAVLAMPFGVLIVYETLAQLFYRDTLSLGLPSGDTLQLLRLDLRLVWDQFPTAVAPVPSSGSYLVVATLAVGVVALLADAFAFRAYGRAEAAVPSGVLFIFTAALGTDRNRIWCSAGWLAAALLVVAFLRALHGGADESWLGRRGRALRAAAPAAVLCAVVAALVAAIVGPQLPGARSEALLDTRQGDGEVTEVISPLVDIRSRLVNRTNTEMFTVGASAGRYWRLSGLSEFDGRQWGLPSETLEDASGELNIAPRGLPVLQQRVTISRMRGKLLPAVFAPITVDGIGVTWLPSTDTLVVENGFADGDTFTISSTDLHPSPEQLRVTSSGSISNEFFSLPPDFPNEVTILAQQIVAGATTSYDKALLLQNYFRQNFTYDLTVQKGHSEDAIISFLRIKRGYCEQFSATFAAMARSLGIPARVAVGFTAGELQVDGRYHVYGKNAHAWPEVWFDGFGWVAFEPTPGRGQPGAEETTGVAASQDTTPLPQGGEGEAPASTTPTSVARPTASTEPGIGSGASVTTVAPSSIAAKPASDDGISTTGWVVLALFGLGAWMVLMPLAVRRFTSVSSTPTGRVIDAWHGTIGSLQLAGAPEPIGASPIEFAHLIEQRMPIDHRSLNELARFVTRAIYAPAGVGEPVALRAAVLRTHLDQTAMQITPWRTRIMMRIDPRLVRRRLVGDRRHA